MYHRRRSLANGLDQGLADVGGVAGDHHMKALDLGPMRGQNSPPRSQTRKASNKSKVTRSGSPDREGRQSSTRHSQDEVLSVLIALHTQTSELMKSVCKWQHHYGQVLDKVPAQLDVVLARLASGPDAPDARSTSKRSGRNARSTSKDSGRAPEHPSEICLDSVAGQVGVKASAPSGSTAPPILNLERHESDPASNDTTISDDDAHSRSPERRSSPDRQHSQESPDMQRLSSKESLPSAVQVPSHGDNSGEAIPASLPGQAPPAPGSPKEIQDSAAIAVDLTPTPPSPPSPSLMPVLTDSGTDSLASDQPARRGSFCSLASSIGSKESSMTRGSDLSKQCAGADSSTCMGPPLQPLEESPQLSMQRLFSDASTGGQSVQLSLGPRSAHANRHSTFSNRHSTFSTRSEGSKASAYRVPKTSTSIASSVGSTDSKSGMSLADILAARSSTNTMLTVHSGHSSTSNDGMTSTSSLKLQPSPSMLSLASSASAMHHSISGDSKNMAMVEPSTIPPSRTVSLTNCIKSCANAARHGGTSVEFHGTLCCGFELEGSWLQEAQPSKGKGSLLKKKTFARNISSASTSEGDNGGRSGGRSKYMLEPGSRLKMFIDIVTSIALLAEGVITPFSVCFRPPLTSQGTIGRALATGFWLVDVIVNFFTGYNINGRIVVEFRPVAVHYLKTWCFFDVLLVALDIFGLAVEMSAKGDSSAIQGLETLRVLRLLRLHKLKRKWSEMGRMVESESLRVVLAMLFRLGLIAFTTHFAACGWYACGKYYGDGGWVKAYGYNKESLYLQYMLSLHWAVTQVHGTMEISPQNALERTYAVLVLFKSLFVLTVLIGNFAGLLSDLFAARNYKEHQLWLLRRYFKQLRIGNWVREKVETHLQNALNNRAKQVFADSIQILEYLPTGLAQEVKAESYFSHTSTHEMFACLCHENHQIMHLMNAFETHWMYSGDIVFQAGDECSHMLYFMDAGATYYPGKDLLGVVCISNGDGIREEEEEYRSEDSMATTHIGNHALLLPPDAYPGWCSINSNRSEELIYPSEMEGVELDQTGQWVSEPVMWLMEWVGLGDLVIRKSCQAIHVDAKIFQEKATDDFHLFTQMAKYAKAYVLEINRTPTDELTDIVKLSHEALVSAELVKPTIKKAMSGASTPIRNSLLHSIRTSVTSRDGTSSVLPIVEDHAS